MSSRIVEPLSQTAMTIPAAKPSESIDGTPANQPPAAVERAMRRADQGVSRTRWQARLLPLMAGVLVALGVFFVVESVRQMQSLQGYIRGTSRFELGVVPEAPNVSSELRARLALEVYSLEQRERLANYMLASRTWTRYMAFITGMVLALVGAAFVLGKLREEATKLDADAASVKFSLGTSSPGIVLATLGTILMLAAIVITFDVSGNWSPVYLPTVVVEDSTAEPPPPGGPPANAPTYPGVIRK